MKAWRNLVAAGALVAAGVALSAPGCAFAGPRAPHTMFLVGRDGATSPGALAHGRFDRVAGFDRQGEWRRRRHRWGLLNGGTIAVFAPQFAPPEAQWSQIVVNSAPDAGHGFTPDRLAGPKIIEIGARPRRHIRFPLVVYGDS